MGTVERLGDHTGCGRILWHHLTTQDRHLQAIFQDPRQIGVAIRHCDWVGRTIWTQSLDQVQLVTDLPVRTIRQTQHEQEVRVRPRTIHGIDVCDESFDQQRVVARVYVVLQT